MKERAKIGLLLACFAICAAAAWLDGFVADHRPPKPAELYAVVHQQLTAFRLADYQGAYRQASLAFQEKFNIDQFTEMIREDYGAVIDAQRVEFGPVEIDSGHALVQVFFFDKQGQVLPCVYSLIREDDSWKIDGARSMRRWRSGQRLGGKRA